MRKGYCVEQEFSPDHLGSTLHLRLSNGDPTASAEIAEIFLPLLNKRMAFHVRSEPDPQLAEQAVIDALMSYLERPAQYNPTKTLDLLGYLVMSAKGDLANARDSERRRATHHIEPARGVANSSDGSEHETEYADDTDFVTEILHRNSETYAWLGEQLQLSSDLDVVELMLEGVHRTEPYAIVLELTHMPYPEQALMVKQHKDRIKARLRRKLDPERIRAGARGDD